MSPSLDPISDLRQLTEFPFMVNALAAGTIVAVLAGVAGWFVVLRRATFAGHTLSVMAFPGASAALLLGLPSPAGYFLACSLAALALGVGGSSRRASGQAAALTGTVQAAGLAAGFLFLSLYRGVLASAESVLFGTFLGITRGQVLALLGVCALALCFFALVGRPLLFASVDGDVAAARGVPVRGLAVAFLLVLGLAVAETAQITGALLVFALLVAPAATAQLLTARALLGVPLAVALGVLTTWLALALAYFYGYPVGFWLGSIALALYCVARLAGAATARA
jgi:zinc/manganese transport system permease protein